MTDQTVLTKKSYHHGDLRKALLDEAAKMIREDGEDALSMRKLAARAGVSRTAPYHHFADKQTLLCAVAEEGFRQFTEMLSMANAGGEDVVSEAAIRRFVKAYVTFAVEHAEYYDLMFGGHLWKTEALTDALRKIAHGSFRSYVDRVRTWQQEGWVPQSVDPLRYSQVSWSTLHGISRLMIDGIYVDPAAIEPMCDNAAAMFWSQLQPR